MIQYTQPLKNTPRTLFKEFTFLLYCCSALWLCKASKSRQVTNNSFFRQQQ
jgi:hypothetical protein